MNTKLEEFINTACIWYCRNKTRKSRYEGFPERVKEYMGYSFAHRCARGLFGFEPMGEVRL